MFVALGRTWWAPRIGPDALLAARGDFSRERADLFRAVALRGGDDAASRFFDEVPAAVDVWRDYLRLNPGFGDLGVRDREIVRRRWSRGPMEIGDLAFIAGLDGRDYDLARANIKSFRYESPHVETLLALDEPRARREILARPIAPENLVTLVRWGVPRPEVERAIANLPSRPEDSVDTAPALPRAALEIRLILEDQTLADPDAELRRRGLVVPTRRFRPPQIDPPSPSAPGPFPAGKPLTWANQEWARAVLVHDPHDLEARALLRRRVRSPYGGGAGFTSRALVRAGDEETIAEVRAKLGAPGAIDVLEGLRSCDGAHGARLLASPVVRLHRWPWVRILATIRLTEIGAVARPSLALYRANPCRDARRLARGETPFALGRGVLGSMMSDSWSNTFELEPLR